MSCGGHMFHSVTSARFLLHVYPCSEQVERWHGLGLVPQVRVRLLDVNLGRGRFGPARRVFSTHDLWPSTPIRSPPLRSPAKHSCWWELPHLCGGKVRLLITRFSAGDRKIPGLKPI